MTDIVIEVVEQIIELDLIGPGAAVALEAAASASVDADRAEQAADEAEALAGTHTVDFSGGVTEGTPVFGYPGLINNNPARWTYSVDGSGYLVVTLNMTTITYMGWRTKAARKANRTFRFQAAMPPAAGFVANQPGIALAFDPSGSTGTDATVSADARFLVARAGLVQWETGLGGADASLTVTKRSSSPTVPVPVADQVWTLTFVENYDGSGTFTFQAGATTAIYDAPVLPQGFLMAAVRAQKSTTAPVLSIRPPTWYDTSTLNNVTEVVEEVAFVPPPSVGLILPSYGSRIRYYSAPNTLHRALAPGFAEPPAWVSAVHGPGHVETTKELIEAFIDNDPSILSQGIAYVSPTGTSGGVVGDRLQPFSVNHALQNLPNQFIVALDGVYGSDIDFRHTHTHGTKRKLLMAEHRGGAVLRMPGEDLSALTWTPVVGLSGAFEATYTGTHGLTALHRIVNRDIYDRWGFPSRAKLVTSTANFGVLPRVFAVDTVAKKISLRWDGLDIEAIKAVLKGYWYNAAGNSRLLMIGSELMLHGMVMDGVNITGLSGTANRPPRPWLDDCQQVFAAGYGVGEANLAGTQAMIARTRIHAPQLDATNFNSSDDVVARSFTMKSFITMGGDYDTFGETDVTENDQGRSQHGGTAIGMGNHYADNRGQEVADTSFDPYVNLTHEIGSLFEDNTTRNDGRIGIQLDGPTVSPGAANSRKGWFDTCEVRGTNINAADRLVLSNGASAKIYNSPTLLPARVYAPSVAPTAYTPDAP